MTGTYQIEIQPCKVISATLDSQLTDIDYSLGYAMQSQALPTRTLQPPCSYSIVDVTFDSFQSMLRYHRSNETIEISSTGETIEPIAKDVKVTVILNDPD